MKPILEIRDISKNYRIRHQSAGYLNLREKIWDAFRFEKKVMEDFWALQDVSFDVQRGESIGIVGRNGAGKSTLLKVLSKITPPTKGNIISRGRIASLLEVGTGFHPELTGRENVFFNGSLLGMKRKEIDDKFEQIVDFSGVEKFLDTPLKHYSSGMQLRLAFAVAAFLEAEILIIDEVLAVGDVEFQKKCLGKIEDVTKNEGRTVLFVSHNMNALRLMCNSGIYMNAGTSTQQMKMDDAIALYIESNESHENHKFPLEKDNIVIYHIEVTQDGKSLTEFSGDNPIDLSLHFELKKSFSSFRIGFYIRNQSGELIARKFPSDWQPEYESLAAGSYVFKTQLPECFLTAGTYNLEVHASIFGVIDFGIESLTQRKITINTPAKFNKSRLGEKTSPGYVLWSGDFSVQKLK